VKTKASQFVCDQFKIGEIVFEYQSKKLSRHFQTSLHCLIGVRGAILGVSEFSGRN
jgi:hypothetical protein